MRRMLITALLLTSLVPVAHAAQGMSLRWDACLAAGGTSNRQFACNTNAGSEYLFASFALDSTVDRVNGMHVVVMLTTASGALPNWWGVLGVGTCRPNTLSGSVAPGVEGAQCTNHYTASAAGGIVVSVSNPDWVRWTASYAPLGTMTLPAHQETFALRLAVSHLKTVGAGACGGCDVPVCIGLQEIWITRDVGAGDVHLYDELVPGGSTVGWQGPAPSSELQASGSLGHAWPYRIVHCAAAVPVRNHTWGSLKSLYH